MKRTATAAKLPLTKQGQAGMDLLTDDRWLCQQLRKWLDDPPITGGVLTASMGGRGPLDELLRVFPMSRRLPMPALVAAAMPVKVIPRGACRWCIAYSEAIIASVDVPAPTGALKSLLGEQCDVCLRRTSQSLGLRVARSTRQANAVTASAARATHHDPVSQPCVTCFRWREAGRAALTAGAAVPMLGFHKPKLGPTGVLNLAKPKVYAHSIEGAHCNCTTCKAKRSAMMRARGWSPRW